jgi:hypothetical protein
MGLTCFRDYAYGDKYVIGRYLVDDSWLSWKDFMLIILSTQSGWQDPRRLNSHLVSLQSHHPKTYVIV